MGRRSGPTLADRLAASTRAPTTTPSATTASTSSPAAEQGEKAEAVRERPVVARHCWVSGLAEAPGRHPGLLAEWRHDQVSGRWLGRVVYAVDEHGREVLVERWIPAEHLTPA